MEKDIERRLVQGVTDIGGLAYKFVSPAHRGVADRVVCLPNGSTWFVELKSPTGKLSPLQVFFRDQMRRLNQNYACLYSRDEVDLWLSERRDELA